MVPLPALRAEEVLLEQTSQFLFCWGRHAAPALVAQQSAATSPPLPAAEPPICPGVSTQPGSKTHRAWRKSFKAKPGGSPVADTHDYIKAARPCVQNSSEA